MSSKSKIAMSALVTVLVLAVVGLAIGLVLVASQAALGSSMRVQYTAGSQVDCQIVASAKNYATAADTTGTVINIKNGEVYDLASKTVDIDASLSDDEATATSIGSIDFNKIALAAQGRAVYKFDFKNTAGAGAGDIKVSLSAAISTDEEDYANPAYDAAKAANVIVGVGLTEEAALAATTTTAEVAELSVGDAATSIYVVLKVKDASVDADGVANVSISIMPDTGVGA